MSSTLGEKLRHAREERGISVSEVAEQTRISPLYIEAIEKDDYKILPGGIFNKGFVRSFAKYVGFDEQEALQDYSNIAAANEIKEEEKQLSYRPEVLTDDRAATSFPTIIFAVIILALMAVGGFFLVDYVQKQQSEPLVISNAPANNSNLNTNTAATSAPTPAAGAVPTMENLKVEFTAAGNDISLGSVIDGKKANELIESNTSATFEPKQSLRLSYSKSLAQSAQLKLNGRQIKLPMAPFVPRRMAIEIDITPENLAQIWQNGEITGGPAVSSENTPAAPAAQTGMLPVARSTPRPISAATPSAARPSAAPANTPIIVGSPPANTAQLDPNE